MLTIENTDSDLKVHVLYYANELLVRVRFSFQKLLQIVVKFNIPLFYSKGDFWSRRCENFFVSSIFDDHAVLCAVKSDKQKFKDKAFINRWSASQIKHITARSNSRLRQKILCDIDYPSFAVVEVFLCRGVDGQDGGLSATSIWQTHFRSIFELFRGLLQIVVNVKVSATHLWFLEFLF